MKYRFLPKFVDELEVLPLEIQKKFQKQLKLLLSNIRYPSLCVKKYGGESDIWQARVDKNHRFYFRIENDCYIFTQIIKHPK